MKRLYGTIDQFRIMLQAYFMYCLAQCCTVKNNCSTNQYCCLKEVCQRNETAKNQ